MAGNAQETRAKAFRGTQPSYLLQYGVPCTVQDKHWLQKVLQMAAHDKIIDSKFDILQRLPHSCELSAAVV